jgi:SAM-dependent methyltransferase
MRKNDLDLSRYDSDKTQYLQWYDPFFEPFLGREVSLLELGIFKGGSLLMWRDYFPKGSIVGIDRTLPAGFTPPDRIKIFEGDQTDFKFLSKAANATAPAGFDIIIDDASHMGEFTKLSFWHLFDKHLKPGGIYAIEDWGTGYFPNWPDGAALDLEEYKKPRDSKYPNQFSSHNHGMVGFIKQLVDEQAAADVTKFTGSPRNSKFSSMVITPFIVFITKAVS